MAQAMPLQVTASNTGQNFFSRSGIWRVLHFAIKSPPLSLEDFRAQAQEALTLLVDQLLAVVDQSPERDQACNVAVQSFRPDCSSSRVTVNNLSLGCVCDNVFHVDNDAAQIQEWVQQKHPFLFQTRAQVADQPFGSAEGEDLRRLCHVIKTSIRNCTVDQNGVVIFPISDPNLGAAQ